MCCLLTMERFNKTLVNFVINKNYYHIPQIKGGYSRKHAVAVYQYILLVKISAILFGKIITYGDVLSAYHAVFLHH